MKLTSRLSQEFRSSGDKTGFSPDLLMVCCVLYLSICVGASPAESAQKQQAPKKPAVDMTAVQTQVMLARAGFSPGEIDGTIGPGTRRALDAFTKGGGHADALPADAVTAYRIT